MTTEQAPTEAPTSVPTYDSTEASIEPGAPAQTVRIPNVSPGARSGLEHTVIGSDALASPEDSIEPADETEGDGIPLDSTEARLSWVADAEDKPSAVNRADAVWAYEEGQGATEEQLTALSAGLRTAVYGNDPDAPTRVPGTEAETDGPPGPAINDETGEETPAGDPLPPVQQLDGQVLDPATAPDGTPIEQDGASS